MNPIHTLNKRLLLVDDDADSLDSIGQGLTLLAGATVFTASSGQEALKKLQGEAVDAMVTDFRMPEMDGIELTRRARKLRPRLPVVMITAFNDEDLQEAALKAGVCDIIPKPVDVEPLVEAVEACIG
jgi:two-component system response regulator GlrR